MGIEGGLGMESDKAGNRAGNYPSTSLFSWLPAPQASSAFFGKMLRYNESPRNFLCVWSRIHWTCHRVVP